MKLFSETFSEVNSDEDLDSLAKQFPDYDRGYLCQATYGLRKKTKDWMEELWKQYEPYADSHFLEDFKHQFAQRAWELYLGTTFINHGFVLAKHNDEGPDFDLCDTNGKRITWVEAISVKKGAGPDKVPDTAYNRASTIPTDEMVLRLATGLDTKFKKYVQDCQKGIIKDNESYVIAIDRSEVEHLDAMLPNILKVLFGIGQLALQMRLGGKPVENPESFWTHEPFIKKQNGSSISMHFFDNPEHSGISAVIYSKDGILNSPRNPHMGENFFIVHNPLAKNPLSHGFLPFGEEYVAEDGYVKKIKDAGKFNRPDAFEFLEN